MVKQIEDEIIKGLDFELKSGELMVVVGPVGAGKTTLLHSIMDETKVCKGTH
jgi:ABC-type multidrug transport system ATPase subunit